MPFYCSNGHDCGHGRDYDHVSVRVPYCPLPKHEYIHIYQYIGIIFKCSNFFIFINDPLTFLLIKNDNLPSEKLPLPGYSFSDDGHD